VPINVPGIRFLEETSCRFPHRDRYTRAARIRAQRSDVLIDDFCVADDRLWPTVGRALLDRLRATGRDEGWKQFVMVSGWRDKAKQKFLYE